ncbi:MAG: Rne/Rng family ribonuclease [Acidimicrobiia bacterium]|nr:Rne/Rng family ribonuclease [Acidimicrobiia bacterium]
MGLFKKKSPRVVRKGDQRVEHEVRTVNGQEYVVRKPVEPVSSNTTTKDKPRKQQQPKQRQQTSKQRQKPSKSNRSSNQRRRPQTEIIEPPETARKQMLVRKSPSQTQIVVLEGPVLVEHYVASTDRQSLVGNVYMGKVRNVLPGMEAAFVDFGEGKNGVLYAGDVDYRDYGLTGKSRRIENALKPGDPVLVQVVKDAMGHKGARLTNEISLAGRYLVLAPNEDVRGISRRLSDDERRRLREIVGDLRPKGTGIIVRTAAEGATREDIKGDIDRLKAVWDAIETEKGKVSAPALIYEEPPLVIRVIREHFTRDFKRLLIDDTETHRQVLDYLEGTEADLVEKVKLYDDDLALFERYHVEDQLRKALDRKVWLPSGGHLVIDRTEALTVIDVNTGRFVGKDNLEQTVYENNLESAEEIARQLRLRDIGGIIVIDFIDMEDKNRQEAVLLRLREHLAKDKTRTQVFEVSHLGLVEMTRKNVSAGLLESFSEPCPQCNGRGVLLHEEAAATGVPAHDAGAHEASE